MKTARPTTWSPISKSCSEQLFCELRQIFSKKMSDMLRISPHIFYLLLVSTLLAPMNAISQAIDTLSIQQTIVTFSSTEDLLFLNGDLVNLTDLGNNGNLRMEDNARVMLGGDLTNHVLAVPLMAPTSEGRIVFTAVDTQRVNGAGAHIYYRLQLATGFQGEVKLDRDMQVRDTLLLGSGTLNLQNQALDLKNSGHLVGETNSSRIYGDSLGYLRAIRFTNAAPLEVAGTGAELTSTFDSVEIRRYHQQFLNVADSSILRSYAVTVRNGSGANAAMEFNYLDPELDGIPETSFAMFSSANLTSWTNIGGVHDSVGNSLTATNIAAPVNNPKRYTVTSEDCASISNVQLGNDTSICQRSALLLDAGNVGATYLWSTGATTQTIIVDSAALDTTHLFWVEVGDMRGCRSRDTIGISSNYPISANIGPGQVACFGDTVTLDLGSGFSQYLWNIGDTTQTLAVDSAGTYIGTVQNLGFMAQDQSNLVLSTEGGAVTSISQVMRAGGSGELSRIDVGIGPNSQAGNLTLVVYADSTSNRPIYSQRFPYSAGTVNAFAINAPIRIRANRYYRFALQPDSSLTPMLNTAYGPGNSSLPGQDLRFSTFIQYPNSCPASDTALVNFLAAPPAPLAGDTLRCGPGSITLTVAPGGGGTDVRWYADSTTTTATFTGTTFTTPVLSATTSYFVTTLTGSGCESLSRDRLTIVIAPQPSTSTSLTPVLCFGASTGAIDLTVSNGTPAYTYTWSNGSTVEDISALLAGSYTVTVSDQNGCIATQSATVTQPAAPISRFGTVTHVSCFGTANGAIDLSVAGGTPPYAYTWSNSATTQDLSGLTAGTYSATITDANGCTSTYSATVTTPAAIILSSTAQDVSCNGGGNGTIDLTVQGGIAPFTYNWSNSQSTQDLVNLSAGTYTVTFTDAAGCTANLSDTVGEPTLMVSSIQATDLQCSGMSTGALDLTVSGGTPAYTYQWNNLATTQDISGLVGGSYAVTVTDGNGCTLSNSAVVAGPSPLVITASTTFSTCGTATGSATAIVSGGTPGYTYFWPFTGATTIISTGFPAGNYALIVTDANLCTDSITVAISDLGAPLLSLDSIVHVSCANLANGAVMVATSGGTGTISYLWSNGATTEDLLGVGGGTYTLTAMDSSGCQANLAAQVNSPSALTVSTASQNPLCFGGSSGTATAYALGGMPGYGYLWSNGATTAVVSNLPAGDHSVTVTDQNGCSRIDTVTLSDPPSMIGGVIGTDVLCFGGSDGSGDLFVALGTPPYQYLWSNGQISEDIFNLQAGIYQVTVTDQNGCIGITAVSIAEPPALEAADSVLSITCNGAADGAIQLLASGGTTPYSFLWSSGATTQNINGLSSGFYAATVTDANGCQVTTLDSLSEPTEILVLDSILHIACGGGNTGAIFLDVLGGSGGYTYLWANGATSDDIIGLIGGTYTVTVSDINGCTASLQSTVLEPSPILIEDSVVGVTCLGYADGIVSLTLSGGLPGYTYAWSSGDSTDLVVGLPEGSYTVTVTDQRGCFALDTITVMGGDSALQAIFVSATYVDAGDTVYLYELSQPEPATVFWDFGDGTTDSTSAPFHVYARDTLADTTAYQVRMVVSNAWCIDSVTKTIFVNNAVQKANDDPAMDPNAFFIEAVLFPNPNQGTFFVSLHLSAPNEVLINIYDLHGRKLLSRLVNGSDSYKTDFNLNNLAQGIYLVQVNSGRYSKSLRMVIQ
jgi:Ig-like domain CHU_C associated/SprB repeat/Secretion system C-terminal sorting domain